MEPNAPKPDPEAPKWEPASAEEVKERYGEAAAKEWEAATGGRRRGLINHLLTHGKMPDIDLSGLKQTKKETKPDPVDKLLAAISERQEEANVREMILSLAYYPWKGKEDTLRADKRTYEAEIVEDERDLAAGDNRVESLNDNIDVRSIEILMIELLLAGELTFDAFKEKLKENKRFERLRASQIEDEYCRIIDTLTRREHIDIDPVDQQKRTKLKP